MTEATKTIRPTLLISGIVPRHQLSLTSISSDHDTTRLNYAIRPQIPDDPATMFDYVFDLESGDKEHPIDSEEGAFVPDSEGQTIGWRLLERGATSNRWTILLKSPPKRGTTRGFVRLSIQVSGETADLAVLDKSDNCDVLET